VSNKLHNKQSHTTTKK